MSSSFLQRSGSSTSQANLAKILNIIVTIPPPPSPPDSINLDLRLGLNLQIPRQPEPLTIPTEEEEEDKVPTAQSGIINFNQNNSHDTSSEGECSPEALPITHGAANEISEITNTSGKGEEEINGEPEDRGGFIDLLLEAARQVSNECANNRNEEEDEKPLTRKRTPSSPAVTRSKRGRRSSPAFNVCDQTEPIVRSRRGRNQALPLRYRDSILEPWRKPPTVLRR